MVWSCRGGRDIVSGIVSGRYRGSTRQWANPSAVSCKRLVQDPHEFSTVKRGLGRLHSVTGDLFLRLVGSLRIWISRCPLRRRHNPLGHMGPSKGIGKEWRAERADRWSFEKHELWFDEVEDGEGAGSNSLGVDLGELRDRERDLGWQCVVCVYICWYCQADQSVHLNRELDPSIMPSVGNLPLMVEPMSRYIENHSYWFKPHNPSGTSRGKKLQGLEISLVHMIWLVLVLVLALV